ncbi:MAG: hypothetical protein EBS05_15915 [Proteobacteria bacterium]|nr:hypothetical protein [Pseudomonadota bacterium]
MGWVRRWSLAIFFLAVTLARATQCPACTVPVFRYGLDHWQADNYRLELPANASQDGQLAEFFRNLGTALPLNLEAKPGTGLEARLLFPHAEEARSPLVWSGLLTPANLAALTDSPARREIARRILSGESVVWVLVESGKQAEDDALAARVEKRLRYLEQVAILQRIDPNDPDSKLGPGPALRVKFSLMRIPGAAVGDPARSKAAQVNGGSDTGAPAETLLLKMLAGPKPAEGLADGSWLAAVFGRGRVLGAWPAADFGDAEIEEACLFLLGACSCQVKRQNPGWDMLMNVNWPEELQAAAVKAAEATAVTSPTPTNITETVSITSGAKLIPAVVPETQSGLALWLGAAGCAAIGLFLVLRRS